MTTQSSRESQRRRPRSGQNRARGAPPSDGLVRLYGFHPVVEALANPRRVVRRLLATENAVARLMAERPDLTVAPSLVGPHEISRLVEADAVHQGLYLETEPLESLRIGDLPSDALVLALDQITDPHNVGAITRTAAAFGVTAIMTTARHSPGATGILAKAASGGLEHVAALTVRNLAEALIQLGSQGFSRIGLDSEGTTEFRTLAPRRPAVIVLGAEGKGLRQRTRDCCDVVARLDMPGAVKSLNVSNAAAIALYGLSALPPG